MSVVAAQWCTCSPPSLPRAPTPSPPVTITHLHRKASAFSGAGELLTGSTLVFRRLVRTDRRGGLFACKARQNGVDEKSKDWVKKSLQIGLCGLEGVYVVWLFFLPFAPGDPVWAIKPETVRDLLGLSLNFFFILPISNAVGIHVIEAPILHPTSEGLFNFIIGWTFMFAPLLFTDNRRNRFDGSLEVLWGFQMFLTNLFLIPYMAFRLNDDGMGNNANKLSNFGLLMTKGAAYVGLIGGIICLLSIWWAFFGRGDGDFGNLVDRWNFFKSYTGSERLAYAFIWDMVLYSVFQPWLIGGNLRNLQEDKVSFIRFVRFVPVLGLAAYLICLDSEKEIN